MRQEPEPSPIILRNDRIEFPPVECADGEGLLAVGGDLSPERLMLAYQNGIFPWFSEGSQILWWSPDPRMVLLPGKIKISKSMRQVIRSGRFRLTRDTCFKEVIENCAHIRRKGQEGTWITEGMLEAYTELHRRGLAKSYEVWEDDTLVGGLYGIDLGHVFCGESMFGTVSNASKHAFIHLAQDLDHQGYTMIDCQFYTEHLASLGAKKMSRKEFMERLRTKNPS